MNRKTNTLNPFQSESSQGLMDGYSGQEDEEDPPMSPDSRKIKSRVRLDPRGLGKLMNHSSSNNASLLQSEQEDWFKLVQEAFPTVLLSMGGLLLTGALLDNLSSWKVFEEISSLYILVPTLLGLKVRFIIQRFYHISSLITEFISHLILYWLEIFKKRILTVLANFRETWK
jgi:hypothetical protein